MSRALILVDHGSRAAEAHAHLEALAAQVRARAPGMRIEIAHMELTSPSLADVITAVASEGATQVLVHPLFLVPGRHLREDIPKLVDEARARHPGIEVRLLRALGEQSEIVDVILAAVLESLVE